MDVLVFIFALQEQTEQEGLITSDPSVQHTASRVMSSVSDGPFG